MPRANSMRIPLLRREGHQRLCPLLHGLPFPELVRKLAPTKALVRLAGYAQLLGQGEHLLAALQGLVRVAQRPQGPGDM